MPLLKHASPLLVSVVLLISIASGAAAQKESSAKRSKPDPSAEFFADRKVRLIDIELTEPAKMALRTNPRSYIVGNVREGTQTFTNVGVHLKGMGSFRRLDEKPSFVLKFDKFLPDREYCGLTKLMLNNSVQDQTYLAELLATGLFRDAGVPAARVTHVRVRLNGTWIDMGGGTGANLDYFGERISRLNKIYVLDLSHSLLEIAKKRTLAKGWTNVETVEADATTFRPPSGPVLRPGCRRSS